MKENDPTTTPKKAQQRALQEARRTRARLLSIFDHAEGMLALEQLEQRFETHLPVFQGKAGQYDALDAMRRDAHREVFLVIRHQLELARLEATQPPTHDSDL